LNYAFHWGVTGPRVKFENNKKFLNKRKDNERFGINKIIDIDKEEKEVDERCIKKNGKFDVDKK